MAGHTGGVTGTRHDRARFRAETASAEAGAGAHEVAQNGGV